MKCYGQNEPMIRVSFEMPADKNKVRRENYDRLLVIGVCSV